MYARCLTLFTAVLCIHADERNKPIALHIGALFNEETSSGDRGQYDLQAAQLAIEEINLRYQDLFNGRYTLTFLSNNSRVIRSRLIVFFHSKMGMCSLV